MRIVVRSYAASALAGGENGNLAIIDFFLVRSLLPLLLSTALRSGGGERVCSSTESTKLEVHYGER